LRSKLTLSVHPSIKSPGQLRSPTEMKKKSKQNPPPTVMASPRSQELKEHRVKQLLFDFLYLQRFVDTSSEADGVTAMLKKTNMPDLDEAAATRLRKNATDYAKKTYLLFALLA
jgi:hypothetical protein